MGAIDKAAQNGGTEPAASVQNGAKAEEAPSRTPAPDQPAPLTKTESDAQTISEPVAAATTGANTNADGQAQVSGADDGSAEAASTRRIQRASRACEVCPSSSLQML
jgi:hypothetical protein